MSEYTPLRDYFIIGDLYSAALVSRHGSIDWLCLPNFDSPSLFGSILDAKNGGSFSIEAPGYLHDASYEEDTAIVHTRYSRDNTAFTVTDFMVPQPLLLSDRSHLLARILRSESGNHSVRFDFAPAPEYGQKTPNFSVEKDSISFFVNGERATLYVPEGARIYTREDRCFIECDITPQTPQSFIIEYAESGASSSFPSALELERMTKEYWHKWVKKGTYFAFCRDTLVRSAITLKLMQFYPTGALVAAPTTSLPEAVGAGRNWDYRYVWIRDATFTLYSLMVLGFIEEADKFFDYIEGILDWENLEEEIDLMYTIQGEEVPEEVTLSHLEGYERSKPVRIGNGAAKQFQLDVYGSLIDAIYFAITRGIEVTEGKKRVLLRLAHSIEKHWMDTDNGIWEVRRDKEHYTYSKVMCWVGIDRLLRLRDIIGLSKEETEHYTNLSIEIKDWIIKNCASEDGTKFYQHTKTTGQDATNFLFVMLKFMDKNDPKTIEVIRNTHEELALNEVLVYRYKTDDGLSGDEGAFLLSSQWMISAYAILGEVEKAEELFRLLEAHLNDQSIMPEEIEPKSGQYLGNMPQAFSHMGYIMSAYYIHKYSSSEQSESISEAFIRTHTPFHPGERAIGGIRNSD